MQPVRTRFHRSSVACLLRSPLSSLRTPVPLTAIAEAIAKLRFGAVVLTVHDGKLVQMDVTERQRFR